MGSRRHLPECSGPLVPSYVDIMTGTSLDDSSYLRIYYPSSITREENDPDKWQAYVDNPRYFQSIIDIAMGRGYRKIMKRVPMPSVVGGFKTPFPKNSPLSEIAEKFPVIVFSHGLWACRYGYTTVASELAAHGYVVAAVEHRDASACVTPYFDNGEMKWLPISSNYTDAETHYKLREQQISRRVLDIKRVVSILVNLNKGCNENLLKDGPDLKMFENRLDFNSLVMGGHSFGGATTLCVLKEMDEFKAGFIVDPWMFPIKDSHIYEKIKQPVICINTQRFSTLQNNRTLVKFMLGPQPGVRKSFCMRNSNHEYFPDAIFILGAIYYKFTEQVDPLIAKDLFNTLIVSFLRDQLGDSVPAACSKLHAVYRAEANKYLIHDSLLVDGKIYPTFRFVNVFHNYLDRIWKIISE